MKRTLRVLALFLFLGVGGLMICPIVGAVSPTDFQPGRIIDDEVFYNKNAMSSAQAIQDFIKAHTPSTCDTWGTQASGYGSLTNAQYATQVMGWPGPPYVCLQNYYENPTTGETSFEKGGGAFDGGKSVGQIIWDVSQQFGINPQVLLVTLRKESLNLYGDSWPMKSQYRYAMGYACPDSGPNYSANCVSDKAGFYKQMYYAAWQLRYYYDHMGEYNYAPGRWNTIQYNPDPACGTKDVYIQNYATASLYIYTPYTPNDAALSAYPGTAPCGAYGNRNFWFMWQEWFGSPYGRAVATPLEITTSDDKGQRFTGDTLNLSFTVTNQSSGSFTYKSIGIAGRDPDGNNIDQVWLTNYTLRPGESKTIKSSFTPTKEGEYQFFVSSWLDGDIGWRACQLNNTESTCFNPYIVQSKPKLSLQYATPSLTTTRKGDTIPLIYTVQNPSKYPLKGGPMNLITWVTGGMTNSTVTMPDVAPKSSVQTPVTRPVPTGKDYINFQIKKGALDATTPNLLIKSPVTLTQGLTLSDSPRARTAVTGSFKIKNFSDHDYTTSDKVCYIIRNAVTDSNHDLGCLTLGTIRAGEEKVFSQVGTFPEAGTYKSYLAIYNGSYWRPFDTYVPEVGNENTTLNFTVKSPVTLTQGLTLSDSPRARTVVTGSFKIKNFSDQAITTNDQVCYIIRDQSGGNHDFGCLPLGTLQPKEEKVFSKLGRFTDAGNYRAYFAIYNGSYWRPFDTYVPETGSESTTLNFMVKPALSLTQGITMTPTSPIAGQSLTGSFKIKNFSDQAITTNDQVCYIIRDQSGGNHDLGCFPIGTLQAGEELTYSRAGKLMQAGGYTAYFAIYNGSSWRPFDTNTLAADNVATSISFTVQP